MGQRLTGRRKGLDIGGSHSTSLDLLDDREMIISRPRCGAWRLIGGASAALFTYRCNNGRFIYSLFFTVRSG